MNPKLTDHERTHHNSLGFSGLASGQRPSGRLAPKTSPNGAHLPARVIARQSRGNHEAIARQSRGGSDWGAKRRGPKQWGAKRRWGEDGAGALISFQRICYRLCFLLGKVRDPTLQRICYRLFFSLEKVRDPTLQRICYRLFRDWKELETPPLPLPLKGGEWLPPEKSWVNGTARIFPQFVFKDFSLIFPQFSTIRVQRFSPNFPTIFHDSCSKTFPKFSNNFPQFVFKDFSQIFPNFSTIRVQRLSPNFPTIIHNLCSKTFPKFSHNFPQFVSQNLTTIRVHECSCSLLRKGRKSLFVDNCFLSPSCHPQKG